MDTQDSLRIVAVADTHGTLPDIPPCDILLIGGDIAPLVPMHDFARQVAFLDGPFRQWLLDIPAAEVVFVPGNHDTVFDWSPGLVPQGLRCRTLIDQGYEHRGVKIYGTPWQRWFHGWAFNAGEEQLHLRWSAIPSDTDILLLHGPPSGYGDYANGENLGSYTLLAKIEEVRPALAVFGHIHEGRGVEELAGPPRRTILANAAMLDGGYKPAGNPFVFSLDRADGLWYATHLP